MTPGCECACCRRDRKHAELAKAVPSALLQSEAVLYRQTGNGLHAWIAYRQCRRHGWPIPAWVLDYFDGCYERLKAPGGTSSPQQTAHALQLGSKGGGASAQIRARRARRNAAIVQDVARRRAAALQERRRLSAAESDQILADVADAAGLSVDRVRQVWSDSAPPRARKTRQLAE